MARTPDFMITVSEVGLINVYIVSIANLTLANFMLHSFYPDFMITVSK